MLIFVPFMMVALVWALVSFNCEFLNHALWKYANPQTSPSRPTASSSQATTMT